MKITKAYANANIALVKYWGKSDLVSNIPAVPSLSMTLDNIGTTVTISSSNSKKTHSLIKDNKLVQGPALVRLSSFLENIRLKFSYDGFLKISTDSNVPYGAGLASSAAFFAALVQALNTFYDFNLDAKALSILARLGSGSAARSMMSSFVALLGGPINDDEAYAFQVSTKLKLAMIIAILNTKPKAISSREAMILTQQTSPFYPGWQSTAQADFEGALKALRDDDFSRLGIIMEHSTLKMHASMWAAQPAVNYFLPTTLALMNFVLNLRKEYGPIAYFTMDAGPNVKILCEQEKLELILNNLKNTQLCEEIRVSYPGCGPQVLA